MFPHSINLYYFIFFARFCYNSNISSSSILLKCFKLFVNKIALLEIAILAIIKSISAIILPCFLSLAFDLANILLDCLSNCNILKLSKTIANTNKRQKINKSDKSEKHPQKEDFFERHKKWTIAGPSCDSMDVIEKNVELPIEIRAGQLVLIPSAGAYTTSYASEFNGFPIPEVVII